jgi:hypothetical protein
MQSVDSNFTSAKFKQLKGKMLISLVVQIVNFFFFVIGGYLQMSIMM